MLHICVQKFDVTCTVKTFLGTKHPHICFDSWEVTADKGASKRARHLLLIHNTRSQWQCAAATLLAAIVGASGQAASGGVERLYFESGMLPNRPKATGHGSEVQLGKLITKAHGGALSLLAFHARTNLPFFCLPANDNDSRFRIMDFWRKIWGLLLLLKGNSLSVLFVSQKV